MTTPGTPRAICMVTDKSTLEITMPKIPVPCNLQPARGSEKPAPGNRKYVYRKKYRSPKKGAA